MRGPNRILQIFLLKCRGASELASRELDEPLGILERTALSGHLLACASCRRFRGQLRLIRAAIRRRRASTQIAGADDETLSQEARHRIAHAIRQASQDDAGG